MRSRIQRDAELERLSRVKQSRAPVTAALGPDLISFFKQSVEKRQGKFGKIAASWCRLVPETLNDHCALDGFTRGSLTVMVDSSSHLYELKQLLLAGLQQQLLLACKSAGLRKIVLRPGRWYQQAQDNDPKRLRFDN